MRNTTIADCIISYLQRYPDYQRLFPFYCIISFQSWKRSGGGIIALIWKKKRIKISRILDKNRESHYLLLVGQIKDKYMKRTRTKPQSANTYGDALIAGLIERYGVVDDQGEVVFPDEWYYLIDTFKMQYNLQKQCEKEIREKGICNYDNGAKRHPLLTTLKELVASNMRILNLIGANPYYRERCKPKEQSNEDISAEDFISALTSNSYEGEE